MKIDSAFVSTCQCSSVKLAWKFEKLTKNGEKLLEGRVGF